MEVAQAELAAVDTSHDCCGAPAARCKHAACLRASEGEARASDECDDDEQRVALLVCLCVCVECEAFVKTKNR